MNFHLKESGAGRGQGGRAPLAGCGGKARANNRGGGGPLTNAAVSGRM